MPISLARALAGPNDNPRRKSLIIFDVLITRSFKTTSYDGKSGRLGTGKGNTGEIVMVLIPIEGIRGGRIQLR